MDKRIKAGADLLAGAKYKPERYEAPERASEGEDGIDYGLIILPPLDGSKCPELENYPEDYVEYAQERLRKYKKEQGALPQWDYSQCRAGLVGDAGELVDRGAAEEIDRQAEEGQRELQRQADEADRAIRGKL